VNWNRRPGLNAPLKEGDGNDKQEEAEVPESSTN